MCNATSIVAVVTRRASRYRHPAGPTPWALFAFALILCAAPGLLVAIPGAEAQTPPRSTITLTTDTASLNENRVGVPVRVTATLSATSSSDVVVVFDFTGGTAEPGDDDTPLDFVPGGADRMTIPAGQLTATQQISLRTVDDNFWESTETIGIGGATDADFDVTGAVITLLDKDTKPHITLSKPPGTPSIEEGFSATFKLTATLQGDPVQADIPIKLTVTLPTGTNAEQDIQWTPDPTTWSMVIPAEGRSAELKVTQTNPDDDRAERQGQVYYGGTATALGESIPVRRVGHFVNPSDILNYSWGILGDRSIPSGKPAEVKFYVQLYSAAVPEDGVTVTLAPRVSDKELRKAFAPPSQTFTFAATNECSKRINAQKKGLCRKEIVWSVTPPALDSLTEIGFTASIDAPNAEIPPKLNKSPWNVLSLLRSLGPLSVDKELQLNATLTGVGGRQAYKANDKIYFVVVFDRGISPPSDLKLRIHLDSGPRDIPCAAPQGNEHRIECAYTVKAGDYDFDKKIRVDAGALGLGATVTDPNDPGTNWPAPVVPAKRIDITVPLEIYGGQRVLQATATALEGFREGGGKQDVKVLITDITRTPSPRDLVIPVAVSHGTTSAGDWKVTRAGSVTIEAGKHEGTGTIQLEAALDGVKEGQETVLIGGSGVVVRPAKLVLNDAPELLLSASPATLSEGDGQVTLTLRVEVEQGALAFGHDLNVFVFPTGSARVGYGQGAYDVLFPRTGASFKLPAGQLFATKELEVTVVDDRLVEGPEQMRLVGWVPFVSVRSANINVVDNDAAPDVKLVASPNRIQEGGGKQNVQVSAELTGSVLSDDVMVTVDVGGEAKEGTSSVADRDFTASWSPSARKIRIPAGQSNGVSQVTLSVDPLDDALAEGPETIAVEGTAEQQNGAKTKLSVQVADVEMEDNDTPGVEVKPTTMTVEAGLSVTYAVRLLSQPDLATGEKVRVAPRVPGGAYLSAQPAALEFDANNWSTAQSLTVVVRPDAPTGDVTIPHTVRGGDYLTVTADPVTVSVVKAPVLTLSLDNASIGENGGVATVTASLDKASAVPVTVTVGAAAKAPAVARDFVLSVAKTLTIAAASTSSSGTVTITARDNDFYAPEGREVTVSGTVSGHDGVEAPAERTLGITDDDVRPSFSVASVAGPENKNLVFTVTRNGASANPVSVKWATALDTAEDAVAASAGDFTEVSTARALSFAAGVTTKKLTVAVTNDKLDEPARETFVVVLSEPSAIAEIAQDGGRAAGGITDDDDPPVFSITGGSATEGDEVTFAVVRAGAVDNVVTVAVHTAEDGAEDANPAAATDYTAIAPARTLTFGKGVTRQEVKVPTTEDDLYEADDETFLAVLSGPALATGDPGTGVSIAADGGSAEGTLKDDDTQPAFSIANAKAGEGDPVTFTVTRAGAMDNVVSVYWSTKAHSGDGVTPASADDYTGTTTATKLDFAASVATVTFTVATTEDATDEPDETFVAELANPGGGARVAKARAVGTIEDDDDLPTATLKLTPDTIAEAGGATTVTATLSHPSSKALTLAVGAKPVAPATASAYAVSAHKTLTIAAGTTSSTGDVTITANPNNVDASDAQVTVTAAANGGRGVLAPAAVTLAITDDDALPGFAVADAAAAEGDAASFVVTRSGATGNVVSVKWATALVDEAGGASAGDFTQTTNPATLNFAAGVTTKTITVRTTEDVLHEGNETFEVRLSEAAKGPNDPAPATPEITDATGVGTIEDDDAAPTGITLAASRDKVGEQAGATTVTVTASVNGTTRYVDAKEVTVSVGGGTATEVTDYAAVTDFTVTIAAGAASAAGTFTLTPTDDTLDEPDETIQVTGASGPLAITADTVTIEDNDATPSFSVADASVPEGGAAAFVVTRSGATGNAVSVDWETALRSGAGAAGAGDFMQATAATLSFAAGDTTKTVTVQTTEDVLHEGNEAFEVRLSGAAKAADDPGPATPVIADATAVGTIEDDDAAPSGITLAASPDAAGEEAGATTVTVTASVNGTTRYVDAKAVVVSVGGRTATEARDYAAVSDFTVTIAAGAASATGTFTLTPTNDTLDEPDETVQTTGTSGSLAITADTLTIEDDDATPSFSVADATATEGGAAAFVVTRSGATGNAVSVDWKTALSSGAGAASAADFTQATNAATLSFAAGDTAKTVTVQTTEDVLHEGNETFEVRLSGAAKASDDPGPATPEIADGTGVGTIEDDDAAPSGITLAASPDKVGEEDGGTRVTVTASVNGGTRYADAKAVVVSVDGGTATEARDYAAVSDFTVTIGAGAASGSGMFTLTPTNDTLDEPDETLQVTGTSGSLAITADTLTIEDDDATPSFSVANATATEGNAAAFVVTRSGATGNAVSVDWKTALSSGAGAASAADFTQATNAATLSFAAGDTTKTVTVQTTEDVLHEGNETFEVRLSGAAKAADDPGPATPQIADATGVGTIEDDDAAPSGITLAASPDKAGEEDSATTVTVTASVNGVTRYADAKAVVVSVGGGTAVEGTDYADVSDFTVTIAAGATSATGTFTLTPTDDTLDEPNETLQVTGASGSLTVTPDTLTIEDDEVTPSFSVADATATEGGAAAFVVTRSGATGNAVSVDWKTALSSGAGAASATDFTQATNAATLSFAAGDTTKTVTVQTTEDVLHEGNETFEVRLSGAAKASSDPGPATPVIADATGVGTIEDDDAAPSGITLAASPDKVGEEDGATTVTVTASVNGLTRYADAKAVVVSVGGGTATEATDYTAVSDFTVTIAAGAASATGTFTLTPTNDTLDEPDETVQITGTSGSLAITADTLTIEDDDATPSFSVADATATEGNAAAFVVTRSGATGNAVSVDWKTALSSGAGAASAADFTQATNAATLSFAAGDTTKTVTVQTTEDVLHEGNETFEVRLSGAAKASNDPGPATPEIADGTGVGTIEDDDAAPSGITLAASPDKAGEEDGGTTVTVTASVNGATRYADAKAVLVSVGGGTATEATDYTAVSDFTVTIGAGAASGSGTFTLTPVNDTLDEPDETIQVTGTSGSLTVTGDTITIEDNDAAPDGITLAASPDKVGEEDRATRVTVTASVNGQTRYVDAQVVRVSVGGGTAMEGTDYTTVSDFTVTIAAGAASATGTFTLTPTNDTLDEPDETIQVTGASGSLTVAGDTITIEDNDAAPSFSVADATVTEGGAAAFVVTRSGATGNAVSVDWKTALLSGAGAASAGDFTQATNAATLSFAAGDTTKTVKVQTTEDVLDEGNETFEVRLSDAAKASDDPGPATPEVTDGTGVGTIEDDDAAPSGITLVASPDKVGEEDGATRVTVTASVNGTTRYVDEKVVVVDVGGGTAIAGTDYTTVSDFTVTIGAGAASAAGTFRLTPINDVVDEPDETIQVTGTSGSLAVTADTLTIEDNETAPTVTLVLTPVKVVEGDAGKVAGTSAVTATLSGDSSEAVVLTVGTAPGEDTATSDYTVSANKKLTIAAETRSSTGTVTVTPVDNDVDAPDKTVTVTATVTGGNGIAAPGSKTLTLEDDDDRGVTVTESGDGTVVEEDGDTDTYTVELNSEPTDTVRIGVASSHTSLATVDVNTLTFTSQNWDQPQTVTVTGANESFANSDGSRTVTITHTVSASGTDYARETVESVEVTVEDNDDAPEIIEVKDKDIGRPNIPPVDEGAGPTQIELVVAFPGETLFDVDKTVTVEVGTSDDTATEGVDYTTVGTHSLTIEAGERGTTFTFTLTPTDDVLDEPDETLRVKATVDGETISTTTTITIEDNDAAPSGITLAASPDKAGEEDSATTVTVTASVNGTTRYVDAKAVVVSVGGGTAVKGTDYAAVSDFTVTIAAGAASAAGTFTLTPTNDTLDEPDETLQITGTSGSLAITADTLTIEDDDATPSFSVADATATEGNAAAFVVTRSGATGNAVSVDWKTALSSGAGAASAADFTQATNAATLSFAAGDTTKTVTVQTTEDVLHEGNETFEVRLSGAAKASSDPGPATPVIADATAVGIIEDNDAAPSGITLAASPDKVGEEDGGTRVTVTASVNGLTRYADAKAVVVSVGGGTATEATDYAAVSDFTVTIAAGADSGSGTFTLTPTNDTLDEPDETLQVTGTSGSLAITADTLTIEDDDATPSFSVADATATEGNAAAFVVTRSGATGNAVSVDWKTALSSGAGAASAADFTQATNAATLSFAAGDTTKTVTVQTTEDVLHEGNETFEVRLSGAAKAADDPGPATPEIADATGVGTIEDDDAAPSGITLAASPDKVGEEDGATTVTVTASVNGLTRYADAKAVVVSVGGGTATEATDYAAVSDFTVTIGAGAASGSGTFRLTPANDTLDEPDETIQVTGTSGSLAVTGDTVTIEDNDTAPGGVTLAASPDKVGEEDGATRVTVTASVNGLTRYADAKAVVVSVDGGTATEATDYTAVTDFTVTIGAGAASGSGTFTLTPVNDTLDEPDETIQVTGASGSLTVTGDTVTIEDNDAVPGGITLAASPDQVGEEDGATTVTVTASVNGTTRYADAKAVVVSVGGGTATEATDYAAVSDFTVTIGAGAASGSGTFTLTPANDTLDEPDETIQVTGTSGSLAVTGDTVTIEDNDAAPGGITLAASPDQVGEEDGATTVTVTASVNGVTRYGSDTAVVVSVGGGTATEATDYAAVSDFTVTIGAGAASGSGTFTLTPVNDTLDEPDETIQVTGTSGSLAVTGDTVTIEDNDAAPGGITLAASPDQVGEEDGATTVTVTASVNGVTRYGSDTAVVVSVGGGTATEATDYAAVSDFTVTIGAGAASGSGTFTLTPANDTLDEPDETIQVTGTSGSLTVTGDTVTIEDNDAAPGGVTLAASPDKVGEEDGATRVTVTASVNGATRYADAKAVVVSVGGGTATEATDYTAVSDFTVTIGAGAASGSETFTLTPVNDTLDEPDETIQVTGTSGSLAVTGDTVTIEDNDAAPGGVTLAASPDQVGEEDGATRVTVTASVNGLTRYGSDTVVRVSVGGGTATEATDYTAVTAFTVTIGAGAASGSGTFTLTPVNDTLDEPDETIQVTGTSGSLTVTGDTITIEDNDAAPSGITLVASPDSVNEGSGATTVMVTASVNGATRPGSDTAVVVSVGGGTATAGEDYAAVSDFTVTIGAGAASGSGTFTLTPANDTLDEPDETIQVTGTSGSLTVTGDTITIEDNDAAPSGITLVASPDSVNEGSGATTVTVTASVNGATRPGSDTAVVVSVGGGTATVGEDYATVSDFTVTIGAGAASGSGTFTLTPINDTLDEPDETIQVTGASGSLTVTGDTVTIEDNDATPGGITLAANPDKVGEEDGATTVTVTASVNGVTRYGSDTAVVVSVGGGTATEATDYATVSDFTVTIGAGAASGSETFTLTPANDTLDEPDETIQVTGTSGSLTVTGDTVTIEDNDAAPGGITLAANPDKVGEEDGATTVTVTASVNGATRPGSDTAVVVSVGGGTATAGEDYATVSDFTVTIGAGAASGSGTFTLTPINDTRDEPNETIQVTGASVSLAVTGDTITLEDNDAAPTPAPRPVPTGITLAASPDKVNEGSGATTVTVTASVDGTARFGSATAVLVSVGGGTATAGEDYATVTDFTVTIGAGAASGSGTFTLTPTNDVMDEPDETIQVTGASGLVTVTGDTIFLEDNDAAPSGLTLVANPDRVGEDDGATTVTVTAWVNGVTRYVDAQAVRVSVGGGTATAGTDYATVGDFTVTIGAGAASGSGTFTLTPTNDVMDEPDETIQVTGASGSLAVTGDTLTLEDNDDAPAVQLVLTPGTITEDGSTSVVSAIMNGQSSQTVTLAVAAAPGAGTAASDYTMTGSTLTIASGAQSSTGRVAITAVDNNLSNPSRYVIVSATASGTVKGPQDVSLTIIDDETAPVGAVLSATPSSLNEDSGKTPVAVTATVDGAPRSAATVLQVSVSPDTAQQADFVPVPGFSLTIAAGETQGTATFHLTPVDDLIDETRETLEIAGTTTVTDYAVTPAGMEIYNTDPPASNVMLSASPASITEEGGPQTITVTARFGKGHRGTDTAVTVSVTGNTASAADFEQVSDFVILIPSGTADASKDFVLTPVDDGVPEETEIITISGTTSVPNLTVFPGALLIMDQDTEPTAVTLSASPDAVPEDGGPRVVQVRAAVDGPGRFPSDRIVRVSVGASGDSARAGIDYANVDTFDVTIPAAAASGTGTFVLAPAPDAIHEQDETLSVTGTLAGVSVTGDTVSIVDDEPVPGVTLVVTPERISENGGGSRVTARLDRKSEVGLAVAVEVAALAVAPAKAGDFELSANRTLLIAAGATESTGDVTLRAVDNDLHEGDKTIRLSGRTGGGDGATAPAPRDLTIVDDDTMPVLSIADARAREGEPMVFMVTRSGAPGNAVAVMWQTLDDADGPFPASAADYAGASTPQKLNFASGEMYKYIEVQTLEDPYVERDETFRARLTEAQGVAMIDPARRDGKGTIEDDDTAKGERITRLNEDILGRVGSALVRSRMDQIGECIEHGASGQGDDVARTLAHWAKANADDANRLDRREARSTRDILNGATLSAGWQSHQEVPSAGDLMLCLGLGADVRSLSSGDSDSFDWDGELWDVHLGGNMRLGSHTLVGVEVSEHRARIDWTLKGAPANADGDWRMNLTTVHPYAAWFNPEGQRLWLIGGFGLGDLRIMEDSDYDEKSDLGLRSVYLGGVVPLDGNWGDLSLRLRGDAWYGTLEADDNGKLVTGAKARLEGARVFLEAQRRVALGDGGWLLPSARLALQYDDSAGGLGTEIGGTLPWESASGVWSGSLAGRVLLARDQGREWGFGADVRMSSAGGLGPFLEVAPSWGVTDDGAAALWDRGLEQTSTGREDDEPGALTLDIKTGWAMRSRENDDVWTPYTGFSLPENDAWAARIGVEMAAASGLNMAMEGERRQPDAGAAEYEVSLKLRIRW